ncbi:MAG: sarcosine oxidase subunit alpha family protein [Gammaproteobacteria bacterium]|nr:sarcosine oxidase subunit alpha family protein [Gammaproteobacteria bacterium]
MSGATRLPAGGVIDRTQPLQFVFNGRQYTGFKGDTLASALLANGIHWVGRSFKTHRPRGIMSADITEPHAIVQLEKGSPNSKPNMLATEIQLFDGLRANSVNVWPSLKWDTTAINQYFSKYLIAGFYYKTFMWPKSFWKKVYEPLIRRKAGLGICEKNTDSQTYNRMDTHCDLLIVGTGPAGLAAAEAASQSDETIILADENPELGSSLIGTPKYDWGQKVIHHLSHQKNVTLLKNSTIFGYHESNYICGRQHLPNGERTWHIHAKRVILATGAHERPLTFYHNDLPGIMLASAANRYLLQYGVTCGQKIVFFTNNDSVYDIARNLLAHKINVLAIIDSRTDAPDTKLNIPIYQNTLVAHATGKTHIKSVTLSTGETIKCDLLLVSGGFNPAVHLFSQSGGTLEYCDTRSCFVPLSTPQAASSAGACNGIFDIEGCILNGQKAALKQSFLPSQTPNISAIWRISSGQKKDTFKQHIVDFAEDVSVADIQLAVREGFNSVEHIKRYTTAGMGIDQGKISNVNVIGLLSETWGKPIPDVGTTTFRAPYTPITFGALAGAERGNLLDPIRTTTLHEKHIQHGAKFEDVGQWKRPWYYPATGETMQDTLNRECLAVHQSVGMLDASTLGKIDIQGKDAGQFLDLIYTNLFSTLKVGACRYGVMCLEDGMVFDDGITARLDETHYYMTTTTSGAAEVLDWMEFWLQTQYPNLEVFLTSLTEQYGSIVVSGPNARKVLQSICPHHPFDNDAFPFMQMKETTIEDIPVRLLRISFTGELSFEIHYPAHSGPKIWDLVYTAGKPYHITPYGTETMHILRAEKGFIIVGQDTDGSVTPIDLNMNWVVSKKKDFLGKRSLRREDTAREDRKVLVGLVTKNPKTVLPEGAQLVVNPKASIPIPMEGYVTSSYYSALLEKSIALALIKNGLNRIGETLYAPIENNKIIEATIVSSVFYDPKGERQNV